MGAQPLRTARQEQRGAVVIVRRRQGDGNSGLFQRTPFLRDGEGVKGLAAGGNERPEGFVE
jgi:hypothetical protein